MIYIIVGGIGSGKTLTAVKYIVDRQNRCFTNFDLFDYKDFTRLKYTHLFKVKGKDMKLNFSFWKEQAKDKFDIYLDEFHNVMGSRRSISKRNVLMSDWLSQVRKILGESEMNNLYLITQKLRRIDINSRDLAHWCVLCRKEEYVNIKIPTVVSVDGKQEVRRLPLVVIYKYFFDGADSLNAYEAFGVGNAVRKITRFVANDYYRYFDSYGFVDFATEEYV